MAAAGEKAAQIQMVIEAIQGRTVPKVAELINGLNESERSEVVRPALTELSAVDPASAQWFIRHMMTSAVRDQLKQGIHAAAIAYMQDSGFVEGRDFEQRQGELILSRAALPYAAADDDPFGQLLVAEFCQLQD